MFSNVIRGKQRAAALKALSILDIFWRPNARTRVSLDIESIASRIDYEPIYTLGSLSPVEMFRGPADTTIIVIGPALIKNDIIVEFQCTRCGAVHERTAVVGDKSFNYSSGSAAFERSTISLSAMEQRCDACVAEVEALEAEIAKANREVHELERRIAALKEEMHDRQMRIAAQAIEDKHPEGKCEVCDRRRAAEEADRLEALERQSCDCCSCTSEDEDPYEDDAEWDD